MENRLIDKGCTNTSLLLDGQSYNVLIRQPVSKPPDAPRLAVVSYLPRATTATLLRLCISTIRKFTDIPYELWVVDNNSPPENIEWLLEDSAVNVILNRTEPKGIGSFANAIGLELVARVVSPDTKYFMTLHQDTAPCKKGWLTYLLSKLDDKVKAAGVRMDSARVKAGVLHVLGYIVDFKVFRKLNLDFFPELPYYDVGDKAIVKLRENGYGIFAAPNSLWDKTLVDQLRDGSPYRKYNFDRSFDDKGDIFFLHLGRGVERSKGNCSNPDKTIELWEEFINTYILAN